MDSSVIKRARAALPLMAVMLLPLACATSATRLETGKEVTLRGKAANAKGGAVVLLREGTPVYVTNLAAWPDKTLGSQVRIRGTVRKHDDRCPKWKPGEMAVQRRCGLSYSISGWKLE